MRRILRCSRLLLLLLACAGALLGAPWATAGEGDPSPPPSGRLTVVVPDLESDEGKVLVALFGSKEAFDDAKDEVRSAFAPIRERQARIVFEDLPFGEYALRIFHDVNDNREIDTNWMGIPKEPFGFSNEAKGRFGPPGYDKARFRFETDDTTLTIRLQTVL